MRGPRIRVAAFLTNPACVWLEGDYHDALHLNALRGFARYQGSGLGGLKIPEAPAAPAAR